jgi:DNA processing protein
MQNNTDPVLYWIGLSSIPGVGRSTFRKLVSHFGSPERALAASPDELKEIERLSDKIVAGFTSFPWRKHAEQERAKAAEARVSIITMDHSDYPDILRKTFDPPLHLYVKGTLKPQDCNAVAIVGTRKPTQYGKTMTHRLSFDLAAAGVTIVSGLARGIDTQAHRGALAAKGRTLAVLGCGIDVAYPPENRVLIEEISRNGAVMTENPFGTRPEAGYFPARNRIISGLSRGTVIIEATEDSGSLITAKNTIEQCRKLYAVPGNVGSVYSRGSNSLIKQGAALIETASDILRDLGMQMPNQWPVKSQRPLPSLTHDEESVFECITYEPKHIDTILHESLSTPGRIGGILINLELKGLAKQLPGKYFVRIES